MSFDARWRELAAQARDSADSSGIPPDLARLARGRAGEPIPFVEPRAGWALAAAAVVLSAVLLRVALRADARAETVVIVPVPEIPSPPSLPLPPVVAAPEHYVALARTTWRELTP